MRSNPFLLLVRPANLITSATDIFAGAAITAVLANGLLYSPNTILSLLLLVSSSICLYAGGIAFNDIFDRELDRIERPERPIPSGKISANTAILFATTLLITGIILAFLHHYISGMIALAIALLSLVYNKWSKHHSWTGPLNMGALRGLNLLLGISIIPHIVYTSPGLVLIPLIYIFAITMVSRGEVHGGSRRPLYYAFILYLLTDLSVLAFGIVHGHMWLPLLFIMIHGAFIIPPLRRAIQEPSAQNIRQTVKHGVLGMILLDAVWVSMSPYWYLSFLLLLLIPVSQKLARYFVVT